jgi:hypothetical protein
MRSWLRGGATTDTDIRFGLRFELQSLGDDRHCDPCPKRLTSEWCSQGKRRKPVNSTD